MKFNRGKLLVFVAVLMLLAAPAVAANDTSDDFDSPEDDSDMETDDDDNETEETESEDVNETEDADDDSSDDGTDNSTELTVSQKEAEQTARDVLSDNNWTLEDASVHEDDGYYKFEFVSGESEAEVRVDGSSGEIFRHEEEMEESEEMGGKSSEVQNLEQARERIAELEKQVQRLKEQVRALGGKPDLPEEASDRAREARDGDSRTEVEVERNGTTVEVEQETEDGKTETKVEVEKNGSKTEIETEGSKRPGFVDNLLKSIFG